MKKTIQHSLVTTFTFILSSAAFACPTLSGNFECYEGAEQQNFTLSTREQAGVNVYNINSLEVIADGVPRKRVATDGRVSIFTTSCEDSTLTINEVTKFSSGFCAQGLVKMDSMSSFISTPDGMEQLEHIKLICPEKPAFLIKKKYQCKKKGSN